MLKETILKYVQYNVWANQRILNEIIAAGGDKVNKEIPSSFISVRKTLYHIYDAESIWLSRLRNEIAEWPASKKFSGTVSEFAVVMIEKSKEFADYVGNLDEGKLSENFIYNNNAGKEFSNERKDCILHCMNHSSYHRGQLVTMLRIAGHEHFESLDFITYCRA